MWDFLRNALVYISGVDLDTSHTLTVKEVNDER